MKKKLAITILFFLLIYIFFPTSTQPREGKEEGIYQLKKEEIDGSKITVLVRGDDAKNPVLLWVSGEDTFSEMCYITKYQEALEECFTIVRYDAYGTGKSISCDQDKHNVTIDKGVEEILGVTDCIRSFLNTDQVILVAEGYATALAIRAAAKAPEKYSMYVGVSQYTSLYEMEKNMIAYCLDQAIKQGQEQDIMELAMLQEKCEEQEKVLPKEYYERYIKKEEDQQSRKDYILGFLLQPEYNIADVVKAYVAGVCISDLLFSELYARDVTAEVVSLSIPCLFVWGTKDHTTSKELCESYLNILEAPYKEFKQFGDSGSYPYRDEEIRFAVWLKGAYEKAENQHK